MTELLHGKAVADCIKARIKKRMESLNGKGMIPKLGIIRVGANPDDLFYEAGAKKTCTAMGIKLEVYTYDNEISQKDLEQAVLEIGANESINGILMGKCNCYHLSFEDTELARYLCGSRHLDCCYWQSEDD